MILDLIQQKCAIFDEGMLNSKAVCIILRPQSVFKKWILHLPTYTCTYMYEFHFRMFLDPMAMHGVCIPMAVSLVSLVTMYVKNIYTKGAMLLRSLLEE